MATIATLRALLTMDSADFVRGSASASASAGKLNAGLSGMAIGGAALAAGVGLATAAIAGVVGAFRSVPRILEEADVLTEVAASFGLTVDAMSRFTRAAELVGGSTSTIETALQKMSVSIVGAADGTGKAAEAFATLGLAVADLRSAGAEQAFVAIGEAINHIPDAMQRAATAQEIFGRGAKDVLRVFSQNEFQETRTAFAVDDRQISLLGQGSDALSDIWRFVKAIASDLIGPFATGLKVVTDLINIYGAGLRSVVQWISAAFGVGIQSVLRMTIDLMTDMVSILLKIGESLAKMLQQSSKLALFGDIFGIDTDQKLEDFASLMGELQVRTEETAKFFKEFVFSLGRAEKVAELAPIIPEDMLGGNDKKGFSFASSPFAQSRFARSPNYIQRDQAIGLLEKIEQHTKKTVEKLGAHGAVGVRG